MNPIDKVFLYITYALIAVSVIFLYWLTYPYNPIKFTNTPYPIRNNIVKSGEYLTYQVSYCKYSDALPLIDKHFIDGIIYAVPQEIAIQKPKGCHVNLVQLYVPKALPPGNYTVEITYHYQVNPVRTVNVTAQTERFTVTNR